MCVDANKSSDCNCRSKMDSDRQDASLISVDMPPKEHGAKTDGSFVGRRIDSLLRSPRSTESSTESTSASTAQSPSGDILKELEEAKVSHWKNILRTKALLTRLQNLQIVQADQHISSQVKSLVDHCQSVISISCQKPVKHSVVKSSTHYVDMEAATLQNKDAPNSSTNVLVGKCESSNSSEKLQAPNGPISHTEELSSDKVRPRMNDIDSRQIKQVTGSLSTIIKHLESAADSEATESSSGGDSYDENEVYDDKTSHSIPIGEQALKTWVDGRASVAKGWMWLQLQVLDLEYQIRNIAYLSTQARAIKSRLCFEEAGPSEPSSLCSAPLKESSPSVNSYLNHNSVVSNNDYHSVQNVPPPPEMPGGSSTQSISNDACGTVSRAHPINLEVFRKRKLLQTSGLHMRSRKAAQLSTARCNCNARDGTMPCILCSGRNDNRPSVDPNAMSLQKRVSLLQPNFHPHLSSEKEVAISLHFGNHLKQSETYYPVPKQSPSTPKRPDLEINPRNLAHQARNQLTRHASQTLLPSAENHDSCYVKDSSSKLRNDEQMLKKRPDSEKKSSDDKDHWPAASNNSSQKKSSAHSSAALNNGRKKFTDSKNHRDGKEYDINDIVIPHELKTVSSFEKLQYKPIVTPSWRIKEVFKLPDGPTECKLDVAEDISDEAFIRRHAVLEIAECESLRGIVPQTTMDKCTRRNSRHDISGANTLDHVPSYQQDIMLQDSNSLVSSGPFSPAISQSDSVFAMPNDLQPTGSIVSTSCTKRRRTISLTEPGQSADKGSRNDVQEYAEEESTSLKSREPLKDAEWEEQRLKSPPYCISLQKEEKDTPAEAVTMSSPASTESTSSNEEDDTDSEWTVVPVDRGKSSLVIKLVKRRKLS